MKTSVFTITGRTAWRREGTRASSRTELQRTPPLLRVVWNHVKCPGLHPDPMPPPDMLRTQIYRRPAHRRPPISPVMEAPASAHAGHAPHAPHASAGTATALRSSARCFSVGPSAAYRRTTQLRRACLHSPSRPPGSSQKNTTTTSWRRSRRRKRGPRYQTPQRKRKDSSPVTKLVDTKFKLK